MIRRTPVPAAMRSRPSGSGERAAAGQFDDGIAALERGDRHLAGGDVLEVEHPGRPAALQRAA